MMTEKELLLQEIAHLRKAIAKREKLLVPLVNCKIPNPTIDRERLMIEAQIEEARVQLKRAQEQFQKKWGDENDFSST